jgi:hypothetical protein
MSTQVQRRRGTTANHSSFTGAIGEITIDTTKNAVVVHDGSTAGGFPQVVNSTTIAATLGSIELGHASDTTISRTGAGAIAVEGVGVALNSTSATHTASTIELGHASDTTLSRSSAGILAVEGVTVPLNSTTSTHTAQQIELGHATDTTLARVSAGVVSIEGVNIATVSSTDTLTNKRVTLRRGTVASSATPTINTDNVDIYEITALAAAITSFTTNLSGTPSAGDPLIITIKDDGTARALTFGASFASSGNVTLPTTTVISTKLTLGFQWDSAASVWRLVGKA